MVLCRAGAVDLPAPVSISVNDEIIWSSNTGRSASGDMIGDVVAEKKNINVKWGVLSETDVVKIRNNLASGFFPFTFHDDGIDITISSYRGTISKDQIGELGDGIFWYRSVSVDIIQQ